MPNFKLLFAAFSVFALVACQPHGVQTVDKLSNAGDSISQGFAANADLSDHPELSWIQGTDPSIDSIFQRYTAKNAALTQQPESVSGAEMVGGDNNFATQAGLICAQTVKPNLVFLLLGANDVCNRDASTTEDAAANLYSVDVFTAAAQAGFDLLADCLPDESTVQVMSMPRVDSLYEAGHNKSVLCYDAIWPVAGICRVVTAEDDAGRRQQIGDRINAYNEALMTQVEAYNSNSNGKNPHGIEFRSDWQGTLEDGHVNTSLGAVTLTADDIDSADCFHPTQETQAKIACAAWGAAPHGAAESTVPSCFN
jgi:lysophospholipase L1-like esterase